MSQARRDFVGTVCRACGGSKKSGMAFCRDCFFLLPLATRRSLYRHLGDGYADAYTAGTVAATER